MNTQSPMDGSTFMIILTTGLYVFTVITWQAMAGIAATLAGFSTLLYNLYKFYRDYKSDKRNQNNKLP